MAPDRVYLDTSAYLEILLGEKRAASLLKIIGAKTLCSSILILVEAERNLVRLSRTGLLATDHFSTALGQLERDRGLFILRELTADLCLTGEFPPVSLPRSSDLIHLRTARWFQAHGGLASFLTLDEQQKKAAQEFGLPV